MTMTFHLATSAPAQKRPTPDSAPSKSAPDAQTYRNSELGFRYEIPYGWVDRTREMREPPATQDTESKTSNPDAKAKPEAAKGEALLAIFERPPEASGDTINSAVIIARESVTAYPGLKKAEDYLAPLAELTTAKGFQPDGDPSVVTIDGRDLVRADFIKALTEKVAMYQSTLAMVVKGQILSFTFIAGREDEVDGLIENLRFAPAK